MEGCKLPPRRPQGDVKEELAGRQREANEWNGKCIQGGVVGGGGGLALSYSYQLIQYLSMEVCTVGGGHGAGGVFQALLPTFTSSVLFNSGRAAVISPVGGQGQAWGVKQILKTTHSSHQNKSGRIKGTQKMSFFAEGGGR